MTEQSPEYVFVRSHGEEVAVGVGRRTPADADWYRALVVNLSIRPEDARRIGEKAIRAAFLRTVLAERKRAGEGIAPADASTRPPGEGETA